jgi:hypothetical protein
MISGRMRTLRGSFREPISDFKRQLILDDGRSNHGLKILSFQMWTDVTNIDAAISASLSLEDTPAGLPFFDAEDNRQIAWVSGAYITSPAQPFNIPYVSIIDPDHIVNESLYIRAFATANVVWNYLIVCEEYTLSDDEAIISLIKERSQNVS